MEGNDNGEPAFPNNDKYGCLYPGMTLRDWFAGQALAGMKTSVEDSHDLSRWAYGTADAMLKQRETPNAATKINNALLKALEDLAKEANKLCPDKHGYIYGLIDNAFDAIAEARGE
jgi:hypothetical protein